MFKVDYFADLYDPAKAARVTHDAQKAMFIMEDTYCNISQEFYSVGFSFYYTNDVMGELTEDVVSHIRLTNPDDVRVFLSRLAVYRQMQSLNANVLTEERYSCYAVLDESKEFADVKDFIVTLCVEDGVAVVELAAMRDAIPDDKIRNTGNSFVRIDHHPTEVFKDIICTLGPEDEKVHNERLAKYVHEFLDDYTVE